MVWEADLDQTGLMCNLYLDVPTVYMHMPTANHRGPSDHRVAVLRTRRETHGRASCEWYSVCDITSSAEVRVAYKHAPASRAEHGHQSILADPRPLARSIEGLKCAPCELLAPPLHAIDEPGEEKGQAGG